MSSMLLNSLMCMLLVVLFFASPADAYFGAGSAFALVLGECFFYNAW